MPITVSREKGALGYALLTLYGSITAAEVVESIEFAFSQRVLQPGLDRIVHVDSSASLHDIGVTDLQEIQSTVISKERANPAGVHFYSVIAVEKPVNRGLASLYKAIWDGANFEGASFEIVETKEAAVAMLSSSTRPQNLNQA